MDVCFGGGSLIGGRKGIGQENPAVSSSSSSSSSNSWLHGCVVLSRVGAGPSIVGSWVGGCISSDSWNVGRASRGVTSPVDPPREPAQATAPQTDAAIHNSCGWVGVFMGAGHGDRYHFLAVSVQVHYSVRVQVWIFTVHFNDRRATSEQLVNINVNSKSVANHNRLTNNLRQHIFT